MGEIDCGWDFYSLTQHREKEREQAGFAAPVIIMCANQRRLSPHAAYAEKYLRNCTTATYSCCKFILLAPSPSCRDLILISFWHGHSRNVGIGWARKGRKECMAHTGLGCGLLKCWWFFYHIFLFYGLATTRFYKVLLLSLEFHAEAHFSATWSRRNMVFNCKPTLLDRRLNTQFPRVAK